MDTESKQWRQVSDLTDTNDVLPSVVVEPWTTLRIRNLYPEWHIDAKCANEGYEKFFGSDSDIRPTMSTSQIREAQQVCFSCPVMEQCLTHALRTHEEYGVWGATSGRTRRRIWRWIRLGWVSADEVIADILAGDVKYYENEDYFYSVGDSYEVAM